MVSAVLDYRKLRLRVLKLLVENHEVRLECWRHLGAGFAFFKTNLLFLNSRLKKNHVPLIA